MGSEAQNYESEVPILVSDLSFVSLACFVCYGQPHCCSLSNVVER